MTKRYPPEVREQALHRYRETGSLSTVESELGIPRNTIYRWSNPAYAEKTRQISLTAKRRRPKKTCPVCGGPMHYDATRACKKCIGKLIGPKLQGKGPTALAALILISERPRRYTEIGRELGLPNYHLSPLIDRLHRYGLVDRPARGIYRITEKGGEALANVNAEVKELVDAIRSYGFQVAIDNEGGGQGGKYKVFKNGEPVQTPNGHSITLPMTPSDNRWRKNTIATLIQARVLPYDPKKEDQIKAAKKQRPAEFQQKLEERRRMSEESNQKRREKMNRYYDKEAERWKPWIEAARNLMVELDVGPMEMARFMMQVADENGIDRPSLKGMGDHMWRLRSGSVTVLNSAYHRLWKAMFKQFNVEEPVLKPAEEEQQVTETKKKLDKPARGRIKLPAGYLTGDPQKKSLVKVAEGLFKCPDCDFRGARPQGVRRHQWSHYKTNCRFCGTEVVLSSQGRHEAACSQNPKNMTEAEAAPVIEPVQEPVAEKPAPVEQLLTPEDLAVMAETLNEQDFSDITAGFEKLSEARHDEYMNLLNLAELVKDIYNESPRKFMRMIDALVQDDETWRKLIILLNA